MSPDKICLLDALLIPQSAERKHYTAHLYTPYSIKNHRRSYMYTHDGYDLWVHLESNPDIANFNERVSPLPIVIDGAAKNLAPNAVSVSKDEKVVVHSIDASTSHEDKGGSVKAIAWKNWSAAQGFEHVVWTADRLRSHPIELANLKRLLRFVSYPEHVPQRALEESITAALKETRKMTLASLIGHFPLSDPEIIKESIADLILDRKVYSDIRHRQLSMITEISFYHDFDED